MLKNTRKAPHPHQNSGSREREVDVLYQKMGNRWFAFSLVDDEIFVGSIPQEDLVLSETQRGKKREIQKT